MKIRHQDESQRGNGFTTLQMQRAPIGAIYIWPAHQSIGYAKSLASFLGREDLKIVAPSVLEHRGERLRGLLAPTIVLDHACDPDPEEYQLLRELRHSLLSSASKQEAR